MIVRCESSSVFKVIAQTVLPQCFNRTWVHAHPVIVPPHGKLLPTRARE